MFFYIKKIANLNARVALLVSVEGNSDATFKWEIVFS